MAWVRTRNIVNFTNQMDRRFPNRDHASDGSIGDAAHQLEPSGHNPDDTPGSRPAWDGDADSKQEVRAQDVDSDLGEAGTSMQDVVDHLRALPGLASVCRYLIYNRKMYHSRDGFAPTPYSGSSPHTEHLHYEGAWSDEADENSTFDFKLEDVGMPSADEIIDRMVARLRDDKDSFAGIMRATPWKYVGGGLQGAASSLWALADTQTIKGTMATIAAAVGKLDNVDEQALGTAIAASLLVPLREAILASLPEGSLTKADVIEAINTAVSKIKLDVSP